MLTRITLVVSLFLVAAAPTVALAEGPATTFLKAKHGVVTKMLHAPAKDAAAKEAREKKVSEIIAGLLDYASLSQKSLADAWDAHTPKEREEFVSLLRQLVERNYKSSLENTSSYTIAYLDEQPVGNAVTVTTKAKSTKNKRSPGVQIDYLVEPRGAAWAVTDVTTDGVSMVANYRMQFRRIIQKDGWAGLIDRMKKRLAAGTEGDL